MSRVFIVDDEPDVVNLLDTMFTFYGFDVDVATDGRSALAGILSNPPDVAIIDLMMPDIDGFELLRLLRADPRSSGMPILILSARTSAKDQQETAELGANAYMCKPFSPRDLMRRVHQLVGEDRG